MQEGFQASFRAIGGAEQPMDRMMQSHMDRGLRKRGRKETCIRWYMSIWTELGMMRKSDARVARVQSMFPARVGAEGMIDGWLTGFVTWDRSLRSDRKLVQPRHFHNIDYCENNIIG